MTVCASYSSFASRFPASLSREVVRQLYVDSLLAVLAKDPSYIWGHKTELAISCRVDHSSRAFSLGEVTRKAVFQFGKCLNRDLLFSW